MSADDAPDALLVQEVQEAILEFAVEHVVSGLVEDHRRAQGPEDAKRLVGALWAVGGNPGVERLPLPDRLVQRPHALLHRGIRIQTVMVGDVHVLLTGPAVLHPFVSACRLLHEAFAPFRL